MPTYNSLSLLLVPIIGTLLWYLSTGGIHEQPNVHHLRSRSDAGPPLNETLANYQLKGFNGDKQDLTHGYVQTSCGANLSVHYTNPEVWGSATGTAKRPVLILTHGYPESSYIWRLVTGTISTRVPVFVPDQPGYGLSTTCCTASGCAYDKRTCAKSIVEAVRSIYGDVHVVFGGHDRGARTMHRAAVDNDYPGITALGVFMADIVPFVPEFASFSDPRYAVGYFHWALLPKQEFATDLIMAYGGGAFATQLLFYGQGSNEHGIELFKSGDAWDVYANFFNQLSVTKASVYDYTAAASIDYDRETWDQGNDTKIEIPTHVMFSIKNLGSQFDVPNIWSRYVKSGVSLTTKGVGNGIGHFIIEEAPDEVIAQLNELLDSLGVDA